MIRKVVSITLIVLCCCDRKVKMNITLKTQFYMWSRFIKLNFNLNGRFAVDKVSPYKLFSCGFLSSCNEFVKFIIQLDCNQRTARANIVLTSQKIHQWTEAFAWRCSVRKMFLKFSKENTCASLSFTKKETLAQMFFCEFC